MQLEDSLSSNTLERNSIASESYNCGVSGFDNFWCVANARLRMPRGKTRQSALIGFRVLGPTLRKTNPQFNNPLSSRFPNARSPVNEAWKPSAFAQTLSSLRGPNGFRVKGVVLYITQGTISNNLFAFALRIGRFSWCSFGGLDESRGGVDLGFSII